jgi:hypothetical protein
LSIADRWWSLGVIHSRTQATEFVLIIFNICGEENFLLVDCCWLCVNLNRLLSLFIVTFEIIRIFK